MLHICMSGDQSLTEHISSNIEDIETFRDRLALPKFISFWKFSNLALLLIQSFKRKWTVLVVSIETRGLGENYVIYILFILYMPHVIQQETQAIKVFSGIDPIVIYKYGKRLARQTTLLITVLSIKLFFFISLLCLPYPQFFISSSN